MEIALKTCLRSHLLVIVFEKRNQNWKDACMILTNKHLVKIEKVFQFYSFFFSMQCLSKRRCCVTIWHDFSIHLKNALCPFWFKIGFKRTTHTRYTFATIFFLCFMAWNIYYVYISKLSSLYKEPLVVLLKLYRPKN